MRAGFNAADLSNLQKTVQNWLGAVEVATAQAAVGLAKFAFEEIIQTAPQYSGDFVENTRVSSDGKVDKMFVPSARTSLGDERRKGHPEAIELARGKAKWVTPKLGTPVIISSTAKHTSEYSVDIEAGRIKLRPVNKDADHIYRKAKFMTMRRYSNINKSKLAELREGKP